MGEVLKFRNQFRKLQSNLCSTCGQAGALASCSSADCRKKKHFHCVLRSGGCFQRNKRMVCGDCLRRGVPENFQLVKDFSSERRLFFRHRKTEFDHPETYQKCYNRLGNLTMISLVPMDLEKSVFKKLFLTKTIFHSQEEKNTVFAFGLQTHHSEKKIIFSVQKIEEEYFRLRAETKEEESLSGHENGGGSEHEDYNFEIALLFSKKEKNNQGICMPLELYDKTREVLCHQNSTDKKFQKFFNDIKNNLIDLKKQEKEQQCLEKMIGFFAFNNPIMKSWLQKVDNDEDRKNSHITDLKLNSFKEYFYKENVEQLNPFEKQKRLEKVHGMVLIN